MNFILILINFLDKKIYDHFGNQLPLKTLTNSLYMNQVTHYLQEDHLFFLLKITMASTQCMNMFIFLHVPATFTLIISYRFQRYMASTLLKMIDMFIDQEQAPKRNYVTRRYARLTNEQREKHVQHVMQN